MAFHSFHELVQVSDFMFCIAITMWHAEFDRVCSNFVSLDPHLVSTLLCVGGFNLMTARSMMLVLVVVVVVCLCDRRKVLIRMT
jgi:uncharacterized membrane protein SirB2